MLLLLHCLNAGSRRLSDFTSLPCVTSSSSRPFVSACVCYLLAGKKWNYGKKWNQPGSPHKTLTKHNTSILHPSNGGSARPYRPPNPISVHNMIAQTNSFRQNHWSTQYVAYSHSRSSIGMQICRRHASFQLENSSYWCQNCRYVGAPYCRVIVSSASDNNISNGWHVILRLFYVFLSRILAIFMTLFILLVFCVMF